MMLSIVTSHKILDNYYIYVSIVDDFILNCNKQVWICYFGMTRRRKKLIVIDITTLD